MKKTPRSTSGATRFAGLVGYAVFHFGSNIASEKVTESFQTELDTNGQRDDVKAYIENDPELRQFVEEAKNIDESTLPFTTKEEAMKVLIRKVGITKLLSLQKKAEEGTITQEEVITSLEENLSEEEINALKVIGFKEIYNE